MNSTEILRYLKSKGAFHEDLHFAYTSGKHGPKYIDMRVVGHDAVFLGRMGASLGEHVVPYAPDLILGPETLGRTLAGFAGEHSHIDAIWCGMDDSPDGEKVASFSPKTNYGRLITPGTRVAIVDDLLTSGSSIRAVSKLVKEHGGEVVVAAVVVRRSPDVDADACNAPALEVLAEVNFESFTEEECKQYGPCSKEEPMVLRPGHGHKWIKDHPMYPVANP